MEAENQDLLERVHRHGTAILKEVSKLGKGESTVDKLLDQVVRQGKGLLSAVEQVRRRRGAKPIRLPD